jgi:hypothetical protein
MTAPVAAASKPPSRMPILMSAFGYPGAGQFMQKRWLAAAVYGLAFTACLVFFAVHVFRILSAYYAFLADFGGTTTPPPLPLKGILVSFAIAILFYVAALVDAYAGYRRACAEWSARRVPPSVQVPSGG